MVFEGGAVAFAPAEGPAGGGDEGPAGRAVAGDWGAGEVITIYEESFVLSLSDVGNVNRVEKCSTC